MAVWTSTVTEDMTKGMTGDEIELLIADLNDAVQGVCEDFGIKA
jgi:division protein CdvB (Snf7/Vps24/ESCRT-III family)